MMIGSRIKELRKKNNLTQEQLANILNITPQAVSRWENGTAMPDISMLIPIANIFKTSTDYLLGVNNNKGENLREALLSSEPGLESLAEKENYFRNTINEDPTSVEALECLSALQLIQLNKSSDNNRNRLEEQIEIYENILKLGGGSIGIDGCVSQIAILSEKLGSTDRITELLKSAHSLKCCFEVLAPKAAAPESKASSYKSLLSACINQAFDSIYQLYQYVSTEDEFEALARAEELFSTVYGKEYFYHSASLVHLYVPVIVFYKKGDTEQVLTRLTRIVEILEYRLHAMIHQPALLNSEEYRITLICNGSISSAQTAAKSLSLWIKEDFSEKDQSNPNIVQILDRLAYIENCNDEKSDE